MMKAIRNGGERPLSNKAVLWCQEYSKANSSALKAWRIAYPNSKSQDNTVYQATRKMLKDPRVLKLLVKIKKKSMAKAQITIERIDQAYADIAFSNIGNIVEWKSEDVVIAWEDDNEGWPVIPVTKQVFTQRIKDSKDLPKSVISAIQEVSMGKDGPQIKMIDRIKALNMLTRRFDEYHQRAHLLQSYQMPEEKPLSDKESKLLKLEFDEKY